MMSAKLFFRGFIAGFRGFGKLVADAINLAVLAFVYYIGIGMVSVVAKALGKHFMKLGRREEKTYWTRTSVGPRDKELYYRQF